MILEDFGVRRFALGLSLIFLGSSVAASPSADDDSREAIRIVGSGYTMPLFVTPWARAFEEKTGVAVRVIPTGTSTAPPALLSGEAEIAAMTRPLNDAEARVLREFFGAVPLELPVAEDEVAVFVNSENPLSRLTLEQLDAIYSKERRCGGASDLKKWGQLGVEGELSTRTISLFGRRTGSGTGSFFRSRALCGGEFKDWMRISPGRESTAMGVSESKFGIGFGSVRTQMSGMKLVALAETGDGSFILPGQNANGAMKYPLARTLNFVIGVNPETSPNPHVLAFLEFIYENASQQEVERAGFSVLRDSLREESLSRLRSIVQD